MPDHDPTRTAPPGDDAPTGDFPDPADPDATASRTDSPAAPGVASEGPLPAVPGYEVEGEIGRGGMGVVYKARHLRLNRPAAVKMLLGGKYHDPAGRVRFLIEAEAVAALQHPHVVGVYEFGQHEGQPFFALEYVGGGTLADRLARDGRLTPRAAGELVVKLADGIAAAHARGIVHRDLKPANVLLAEGGEPKITDFGLAKVGDSGVTASGAVMGTPSYMGPEQAAGRVREVGTPADVYALGAILYECLTGRPPFKGDSAMETIQQVLTREPDRPRGIDPAVPRDVETVCLKCLEKDPAKRYPTAAALAADLRAYLEGRPIAARPVGPVERAAKWARRHPGRAAAIAAVVLAVVGTGVAANEVRRQRQADLRAARADALVQTLVAADPAAVPRLIDDLAEVRDLARPKLVEFAGQPVTAKPGLHARLALVADEPERAAELASHLPACQPEELLTIRAFLKPHAGAVGPGLWAVLADPRTDAGRRVRAAAGLAGLAPDDPRWAAVAPAVADGVARSNPAEFAALAQALEPARDHLLPALAARYTAARERITAGKLSPSDLAAEATGFDLAANLLARYAADRPAALAELVVLIDARHHALIAPAVAANRAAVVPLLLAELGQPGSRGEVPTTDEVPFDAPAAAVLGAAGERTAAPGYEPRMVRRAQAAAVLLTLGEADRVWPLLAHSPDPTVRSHLVARLAGIGADPVALVRRFDAESDTSVKRALLIALGDFPPELVPDSDRQPFEARLLGLYRDHPDPGLHAAIDWLLRRRWGRAADLDRIDAGLTAAAHDRAVASWVRTTLPATVGPAGLAVPSPAADPVGLAGERKDWFVNAEGQTFAVVRGPVEYVMGAYSPEPGRNRAFAQRGIRKHIGRSFAIATREVTLAEFTRFQPSHDRKTMVRRYSPDPDMPAVSMTWYQAAKYCNWLSERDGIPEDQWCYEPNERGLYAEGMTIRPAYLGRTGYRLPTEAEWEFACRAGTVTARYYGRGIGLLPRYAWFLGTSENDHALPCGRLRPNDLGLFDALGNVWEWTQDLGVGQVFLYDSRFRDDEADARYLTIREQNLRMNRGGGHDAAAYYNMAGYRSTDLRPGNTYAILGFRPTRTVP